MAFTPQDEGIMWQRVSAEMAPTSYQCQKMAEEVIDKVGVDRFCAMMATRRERVTGIVRGKPGTVPRIWEGWGGKKFNSPKRLIWMYHCLLFNPEKLSSMESILTWGVVWDAQEEIREHMIEREHFPHHGLIHHTRKLALS